jgi:predicted TIM-barrel fold metal-dependent hydrolase
LGIPILSKDANPKYLEPVVKEYDSVPFVLAHFGAYSSITPGIWFDEAVQLGENVGTFGSISQLCHMWSLREL